MVYSVVVRTKFTFLVLGAVQLLALNPARDIMLRWQNSGSIELLRQAGIDAVILPWPPEKSLRDLRSAYSSIGIELWVEPQPTNSAADAITAIRRARAAGFHGIAVDGAGAWVDEQALRSLTKAQTGFGVMVYLSGRQIGWDVSPGHAILRHGLWPGVRSGPNVPGRGIEVATASREPWVDGNAYLIGYLRGLFPHRTAILGYRPDPAAGLSSGRAVPYDSLELALVEAYTAGGNVVLTLPEDYRAALIKSDAKALAAWKSFGETARFLKEHADLFGRASRSRVMLLAGTLSESGELLNLMFRRNLFPVVAPAAKLPQLDLGPFRALVAANIAPPPEASQRRILDFVRAGGLLLTAGRQAWWSSPAATKIRADTDRDVYALGKGQIIAYRAPIADPSEFALDLIDAMGVRTRDLRLWNASSATGLVSQGAGKASAVLRLINYAEPRQDDFPARVDGLFQKATLLEPGAAPRLLAAAQRGSATEITVDRLGRLAVVLLE